MAKNIYVCDDTVKFDHDIRLKGSDNDVISFNKTESLDYRQNIRNISSNCEVASLIITNVVNENISFNNIILPLNATLVIIGSKSGDIKYQANGSAETVVNINFDLVNHLIVKAPQCNNLKYAVHYVREDEGIEGIIVHGPGYRNTKIIDDDKDCCNLELMTGRIIHFHASYMPNELHIYGTKDTGIIGNIIFDAEHC